MIRNKDNFTLQYPRIHAQRTVLSWRKMGNGIREQTANYDSRKPMTGMKYGEFLLKLTQRTKLKLCQIA